MNVGCHGNMDDCQRQEKGGETHGSLGLGWWCVEVVLK